MFLQLQVSMLSKYFFFFKLELEFVEGEYLYKDLCENEGAGTL